MLQRRLDDLTAGCAEVEWAISIRDHDDRERALTHPDAVMRTASVGKLLLLIEASRQMSSGALDEADVLRRRSRHRVADSGLWQHLDVDHLTARDLSVLIAAVSDNLATNVLLDHLGLPTLTDLSASLGLRHTALLDRVRDQRGPDDPATLSVGSASELSLLVSRLARGALISTEVSNRVCRWLSMGVDLSMVAAPFGLDPLAHSPSDRNLFVFNKTGSDPGVVADVGTVVSGRRSLSYAVVANWDPAAADRRRTALAVMTAIGAALQTALDDGVTEDGDAHRHR